MTDSPELINVASVLAALFFLAKCVEMGMGLYQRFTGRPVHVTPQPFAVTKHSEAVTQDEFREHKEEDRREFAFIHTLIDKRFDALNAERSKSLEHLHQHIGSSCAAIKSDVMDLKREIGDRFKEGNHTMVAHGEAIAGIKAVMGKGGRP